MKLNRETTEKVLLQKMKKIKSKLLQSIEPCFKSVVTCVIVFQSLQMMIRLIQNAHTPSSTHIADVKDCTHRCVYANPLQYGQLHYEL